jgi:hypothetical protein
VPLAVARPTSSGVVAVVVSRVFTVLTLRDAPSFARAGGPPTVTINFRDRLASGGSAGTMSA